MKVVLLDEAEAEIESAAAWYDEQREGLGDEFVQAINDALDSLTESSNLWPLWPSVPQRTPPIRRFVLPRFPYALGYQVHPDLVVVLAIAHERRQPLYWIGRAR